MTKQQQIIRKTNILFLLADMIELTATDLQELHVNLNTYKFDIKRKITEIKRHSGDLARFVSTVYKDDEAQQLSFGETSDIILDKIINEIYHDA